MDYLRTLGSAAVSSLVQKSGLNLPFTLGQKVTSFETFWTLYDATKRVSIPAHFTERITLILHLTRRTTAVPSPSLSMTSTILSIRS